MEFPLTAHAELVEASLFLLALHAKKGRPFDKLRVSGKRGGIVLNR